MALPTKAELLEFANPLISEGKSPEQVRAAIFGRYGIGIGGGGGGVNYDVPPCRICGAFGGGGHGGLCPNGG